MCPQRNKFLEKIKAYERKWCYLPPYNGFGGEEDSIGRLEVGSCVVESKTDKHTDSHTHTHRKLLELTSRAELHQKPSAVSQE